MPAALEGKEPRRSAQWLHNPHQLDPLEPRLSLPVKGSPVSRVKLWLPWEPWGTLGRGWKTLPFAWVGGAPEPRHPARQSGAQKLPVAPPTLSLALPSRVRLFTHKATSAGPASPERRPQRTPSAGPQPRPLAPGRAEGSVPQARAPAPAQR